MKNKRKLNKSNRDDNNKGGKSKLFIATMIFLIMCSVSLPYIASYIAKNKQNITTVPYTQFMSMVDESKVESININFSKPTFTFEDKDNNIYKTDNPRSEDFKKSLLEKDVEINENTSNNTYDIISKILSIVLYGSLLVSVYLSLSMSMGGKKSSTDKRETPDIKLDDIAGNEEVKEEVQVLVDFLKNPEKFKQYGADMPKGVILYGPPGTGKTLTAKAIAGEAGVPFFSVAGSDFEEMFVGLGASRVRKLFKEARKKAPCIIFIEEIDAIGGKRDNKSSSHSDQTINAFLNEMDGFADNEGIIVIATTNRLEALDSAVIRPGRFDRKIMIPLPQTELERTAILKIHTKNKKLADDVSLEKLSKQLIGFSGADIKTLVNEATIQSIVDNRDAVDNESIDIALSRILLNGSKKKHFERDLDEFKLVAYHEAGHAVVTKLLTEDIISKVTIIPSTSGAGGYTMSSPKKMGLSTKDQLLNHVKMLYGGRVAEYILTGDLNKITTGASNDIEKATLKLKEIVSIYGMSDDLGLVNTTLLNLDDKCILTEIKTLAKELYSETEKLLRTNIELLDTLANTLLEKETLLEDEIQQIFDEYNKKIA